MKNKKTVIVLGLPRSGTSVTAGILQALGVEMHGETTPTSLNPKGCFEDSDFAKMDQEIIKKAMKLKIFKKGTYWNNPPSRKQILTAEKTLLKKIQNLIEKKNNRGFPWGWKQPLTLLTVHLYIKHLNNPHFVIVLRNPFHILRSAQKSWNIINKKGAIKRLKTITAHTNTLVGIADIYKNTPYIITTFEDITTNPIEEAKKLSNFLDIDFDKNKEVEIKRFVIPRSTINTEKTKAGILLTISKINYNLSTNINNPKELFGTFYKIIKKSVIKTMRLYKK